MDMKVKSALIRKFRTDRLWSQDQLADACGLSLSTIQRIEKHGNASIETIRALASVLETKPEDIIWNSSGYDVYRHVQRADYILILLFLAGCLVLAAEMGISTFPSSLIGLAFGIIAIVTVLFYALTIEVNESHITWYFGPGFWRKTVSLEEVGDCKTVQNPIWWGFGIRNFGTGWLYNVSGLLAVEVTLNGGSKIRLGTDEPNYLVNAIEDAKCNAL